MDLGGERGKRGRGSPEDKGNCALEELGVLRGEVVLNEHCGQESQIVSEVANEGPTNERRGIGLTDTTQGVGRRAWASVACVCESDGE